MYYTTKYSINTVQRYKYSVTSQWKPGYETTAKLGFHFAEAKFSPNFQLNSIKFP